MSVVRRQMRGGEGRWGNRHALLEKVVIFSVSINNW